MRTVRPIPTFLPVSCVSPAVSLEFHVRYCSQLMTRFRGSLTTCKPNVSRHELTTACQPCGYRFLRASYFHVSQHVKGRNEVSLFVSLHQSNPIIHLGSERYPCQSFEIYLRSSTSPGDVKLHAFETLDRTKDTSSNS